MVLYEQGRQLGDEPDREWSFTLLTCRLLALQASGFDSTYEPLDAWDDVTSVLLAKEYLEQEGIDGLLGYHLSIGFRVFDSALRSITGQLMLPALNEPYRGRHTVALIAYDQALDRLVFVNSWGGPWGDHGIGYMSRSYYERYAEDVMLLRPTWMGPSPTMSSRIRQIAWARGTPGVDDITMWPEAWKRSANRIKAKTISLHGRRHEVRRRVLYNCSGLPYDVAEIREGQELKGRLHLVHDRSNGVSTAWEFWVPKELRRRGYGTALFEVAQELAGYTRTNVLRVPLHEADGSAVGIARAQSFAARLGCRWEEVHGGPRPVTMGVAIKAVG
jgi:GNAT superfamily N-acetyltransferase